MLKTGLSINFGAGKDHMNRTPFNLKNESEAEAIGVKDLIRFNGADN